MIMFIFIALGFLAYVLIGVIITYIFKAYDVIKYDSSEFWNWDGDSDVGIIIGWPIVVIVSIPAIVVIGVIKLIRFFIERPIILITEVARALAKRRKEVEE